MALSNEDLQSLSRLLDAGLALPGPEREAWLAALPEPDRALAPRLRRLLAEHDRPSPAHRLDEPPPLGPLPWVGEPGVRLGPYRLLSALGRGGMGEVWRAERADGAFERTVALKLPRRRLGLDHDLGARLRFECQAVARLEHPHIARLYDSGVDEQGRPWIATELVDGPQLDEHLQRQPLAGRLELLHSVVRAVAYAHDRGVLHGDLKPANVLVAADGTPRLVDFGIGALIDQPDPASPRALTPRYAAPELQAGSANSVQADVYALGVMAQELLATAHDRRGICLPDLEALIAKALSTEASQRYASAALLGDDLAACLRGTPVLARPLGPWARAARWLGGHRLAVGAAAALGLALLATGAGLWQGREAARAEARERQVRSFAAELFRVPAGPSGEQASPVLEHGAQLIATRFAGDAALQAELYAAVGQAYAELGAPRLALAHRERQLAALSALPPGAGLQEARVDLAEVQWQLGDAEAALASLRAVRGQPAQPALRLRAELLAARSAVDLGRFDEATAVLTALEPQLAAGPPSLALAWLRATQADVALRNGRLDEGFAGLDAAAALARRVEGPDSLQAAFILLRGVYAAGMAERRALTERWVAEATRVLRARGGGFRVRAVVEQARMWRALAATLRPVAREEATAGLQACIDELRSLGAAVPPLVLAEVEGRLGDVRFDFGDLGGAALIEAHYPLRVAAVLQPMEALALHGVAAAAAAEVGHYEVALERSLARRRARIEAGRGDHPNVAVDVRQLALIHAMAGQTREALAVLDSAPAPARMRIVTGLEPPWYAHVLLEARARVLLDAGRPQEALAVIPARAPLPQDFVLVGLMTAPDALRGEALCQMGRSAEGWPLLREHIERLNPNRDPHAANVARLRAVAALCARAAGQAAAAQALSAQARESFAARPGVAHYFTAPLRRFDEGART